MILDLLFFNHVRIPGSRVSPRTFSGLDAIRDGLRTLYGLLRGIRISHLWRLNLDFIFLIIELLFLIVIIIIIYLIKMMLLLCLFMFTFILTLYQITIISLAVNLLLLSVANGAWLQLLVIVLDQRVGGLAQRRLLDWILAIFVGIQRLSSLRLNILCFLVYLDVSYLCCSIRHVGLRSLHLSASFQLLDDALGIVLYARNGFSFGLDVDLGFLEF